MTMEIVQGWGGARDREPIGSLFFLYADCDGGLCIGDLDTKGSVFLVVEIGQGFKTAVKAIMDFVFGDRFDFLSIDQHGLWTVSPVQFHHIISYFTLVALAVWGLNLNSGVFARSGDPNSCLGEDVPFVIIGLSIVLIKFQGGALPAGREELKDHGRIF